jgi:putative transposase
MIDRKHEVSIKRQAKLVGISRGTVHYQPRRMSAADLALMRRIEELHLEHPSHGCMGVSESTESLRRRCWA